MHVTVPILQMQACCPAQNAGNPWNFNLFGGVTAITNEGFSVEIFNKMQYNILLENDAGKTVSYKINLLQRGEKL